MKKLVLILALTMLFSVQANAADRDCARYTAAQASEATSDDAGNTVGIVFSGKTTRKGLTNADCGVKAVEAESTDTGSSGGNEYGDVPVYPYEIEPVVPTHNGGSND